MGLSGIKAYALSRKYTDKSILGITGALAGKNCTIESATKSDGLTTIVFKWTADDGTVRRTTIEVEDGTPIYVWESGNSYEYGDIAIYESCFYRCITANSDVVFDDTKWNEIGSPDGNYDIVQSESLLPTRFTSADRKMYYVIDEWCFFLWNGAEWVSQKTLRQTDVMPTPSTAYLNKIIQYTGDTDEDFTQGYFYKCETDGTTYEWKAINVQEVEELTTEQVNNLLDLL